jgi:hypothetical protein
MYIDGRYLSNTKVTSALLCFVYERTGQQGTGLAGYRKKREATPEPFIDKVGQKQQLPTVGCVFSNSRALTKGGQSHNILISPSTTVFMNIVHSIFWHAINRPHSTIYPTCKILCETLVLAAACSSCVQTKTLLNRDLLTMEVE